MKTMTKKLHAMVLQALKPKVWRFLKTENQTYNAGTYIGFPTADSINYDSTTVTHNSGVITISKAGIYRIIVHAAISAQTNGRAWIRLVTYSAGEKIAQSIQYGDFSTHSISVVVKVASTSSFAVSCLEKLAVNQGGIGPTYIEVTKVGGGST